MSKLERLRSQVDRADEALVAALARRMEGVRRIAEVKAALGQAVLDPARERQVLEEAARRAVAAGLDPAVARRVLREVMAASRRWQADRRHQRLTARPRVAYQGAPGAFSWIAARNHFLDKLDAMGFPTFAATLDAVVAGTADCAVVPVENTILGSIHEVLDETAGRDLFIVGEEVLRVEHCLVGLAPLPRERIRTVLSHPAALAQCTRFLRTLPGVECRAWVDTAEAVDRVRADGIVEQVAIASREAAELRGLAVIATDIADQEENYTRFWVLAGKPLETPAGPEARTSLFLVTEHRRGALVEALQALATQGFNLTRLESRPIRGRPWQYSFFIDVDADCADPAFRAALDELRARARVLRVLGCYPRAPLPEGVTVDPGVPCGVAPPPRRSARHSPPSPPSPPEQGMPLASRNRHPTPTVVQVGNVAVGSPGSFVVMAGPCAVESARQIQAAAALVHRCGAAILRGGAFKPRTSPYAFQGLGWEGVDLLVAAGRAHGLPVVTEVMSPEQVGRLAERVDLLQVGARNMQNFPLLRELGRCHKPVLVKRGMSATLEEWLHAAEYILAGGNQQVILCERGIRTFEPAMRATLDLGAVVVLMERTHLPVIVDPSHAAGRRQWVAPLALAAKAVGCAGIIVEVHPHPARARCDAEQALGPEDFATLMAAMQTPEPHAAVRDGADPTAPPPHRPGS